MSAEREVPMNGDVRLGAGALPLMLGAAVVGAGAVGAAALTGEWERFLRAYLTSFAFVLSIALGALFFVLIQHLTRSGWSVTVRRLAEVTAATLLPLALLFIPVILGIAALYEWSHPGEDHLILHKSAWLDPTFFVVRAGVYFGVWVLLSRFFLRTSVRQDGSGDPGLTIRMQRLAPLGTILYGITVTAAAFDLLMSLDPHWFSTIFGVYYFAGSAVGFFAFLCVLAPLLQRAGKMEREITVEHYHDLGKQLFGYTVFWAYIAFSQWMLIWYANIPEETKWFLVRQTGGWETVSYLLIGAHFFLPFLALLPRAAKRNRRFLGAVAALLLAAHWLDLFWLTAPGIEVTGEVRFGLPEILCAVGLSGLFLAAVVGGLRRVGLVPVKDPRLPESLAFENI